MAFDDPPDAPADLDVIPHVEKDLEVLAAPGQPNRVLPGRGRPMEVAAKARRALMRSGAFTKLAEIAAGDRAATQGQLKAIEILLDRGYGKAVDVQAHLHLMTAAGEVSSFGHLSPTLLTALARQLGGGHEPGDNASYVESTPHAKFNETLNSGESTPHIPYAKFDILSRLPRPTQVLTEGELVPSDDHLALRSALPEESVTPNTAETPANFVSAPVGTSDTLSVVGS